jgi:FeS assembly protein IscX
MKPLAPFLALCNAAFTDYAQENFVVEPGGSGVARQRGRRKAGSHTQFQPTLRRPRLDLPMRGADDARMKLTWKDHEEIAWALMDKFPDQDPLKLSFPKLHKMVTELEEFGDKPDASNEKILENIQMAWYEEKK